MGITGCFSYVRRRRTTRSSSSISSALIDIVTPIPTAVANCAVTGTVFNDANADAARDTRRGRRSPAAPRYLDVNGNAILDAGEPSATTDAEGYYVIPTTLTSGTYPVRVVVAGGHSCTAPAVTCAYNATFTARGDERRLNNNFGLLVPATVSGTAYEDANGDAVRDAGENTPLAGRTVFDDADDDGVLDPGESSTTTAATAPTPRRPAARHPRIRFVDGGGWVCDGPPAACTPSPRGGRRRHRRDFLAYGQPTVAARLHRRRRERRPRRWRGRPPAASSVGLYAADGTTLLGHDHDRRGGRLQLLDRQLRRRSSPATTSSASRPRRLRVLGPVRDAVTLISGPGR